MNTLPNSLVTSIFFVLFIPVCKSAVSLPNRTETEENSLEYKIIKGGFRLKELIAKAKLKKDNNETIDPEQMSEIYQSHQELSQLRQEFDDIHGVVEKPEPRIKKAAGQHTKQFQRKNRKRRPKWKKAFKKFWRWYSKKLLTKQRRKNRRAMRRFEEKNNQGNSNPAVTWQYFKKKNNLD